jgi:hypothetical protein
MVYDTVELTEFDMFKEVPKLHTIATACNLDNIAHRLMEGDLVKHQKSVAGD